MTILSFWKQQKAKDLEEVLRHQAEPTFSRSPITGRRAYDGPGLEKPPFIRKKTPFVFKSSENPPFSGKSHHDMAPHDIVGQPRARCDTREELVEIQRKHHEEILRNCRADKGNADADGLAAAVVEMTRQRAKEGSFGEIGALEALRRLRDIADQQSYTEPGHTPLAQAGAAASGSAACRRSASARGAAEGPPPSTPRSARYCPLYSPRDREGTPRSVRDGAREDAPPATPRQEGDSNRVALPTPLSVIDEWERRMKSAPSQGSLAGEAPPDAAGRWDSTWRHVFDPGSWFADQLSTLGSVDGDGADAEPPDAASQADPDARPATAASVAASQADADARPATAASASQGEAAKAGAEEKREAPQYLKEILASVVEVDERDETNLDLLAALDIPPPSSPRLERRAYYLEGYAPRQLPPLRDGKKGSRPMRTPPQVMVLETPPCTSAGQKPYTPLAAVPRPEEYRRQCEIFHNRHQFRAPSTFESKDKGKPVEKSAFNVPKSMAQLPKSPALPKEKPAGTFYVGGKPVFGSKT